MPSKSHCSAIRIPKQVSATQDGGFLIEKKMYVLEITDGERDFLKESLRWSRMGFEERAAKHLANPMLPNYYEDHYQPKIMQFKDMQSKLSLINLEENEHEDTQAS